MGYQLPDHISGCNCESCLEAKKWPYDTGETARMVDISIAHSAKPCIGDQCDDGHTCKRHARTYKLSVRVEKLRRKGNGLKIKEK